MSEHRYEIVKADSFIELEEKVNKMIDNLYIPIGGIAIRHGSQSGAIYAQPMLKQRFPKSVR